MKEVIVALNEDIKINLQKIKLLQKEIDDNKVAIAALQRVCKHAYGCTGHDSHKDHFTCLICGDTYSA
jgi:hypothetical protein